MKRVGVLVSLAAAFGMAFMGAQDAEAKRLGGGKSFGSKPAYSSPYKRSTTPTRPLPRKQAAQQQNTQRRAELANRGGLMGMLGGLALGGLLGALFFGGAFENINFLDIILFGVVAFILYRLFAARAGKTRGHPDVGVQAGGTSSLAGNDEPRDPGAEVRRSLGLDSEEMRRKFGTPEALVSGASKGDPANSGQLSADPPLDFDERAFLEGAERAYRALQDAWDRGDLNEIERLATESVFEELRSQLQGRQSSDRTDILRLESELLEARRLGESLEAAVLFNAYLREGRTASEAGERGQPVREVWHFVRPVNAREPTWYLDGIQQLEG